MNKNNPLLKENRAFYLCYGAWFIILGALSIIFPKGDSFIWINHWRFFPSDIFFSIITWLGTGYFIIPLSVVFFIIKKSDLATGILLSFIISGIIVVILKRYFNYPRPETYFSDKAVVKSVFWVPLRLKYSFPSGHATSVFAIGTIFALFSRNKGIVAIICFALACIVAYSRVYLGEHFVEDIWVGSLIGTVIGTIYFWAFSKIIRKNEDGNNRI